MMQDKHQYDDYQGYHKLNRQIFLKADEYDATKFIQSSYKPTATPEEAEAKVDDQAQRIEARAKLQQAHQLTEVESKRVNADTNETAENKSRAKDAMTVALQAKTNQQWAKWSSLIIEDNDECSKEPNCRGAIGIK